MNYAGNIAQSLLEGHLICAYETKEDYQRLSQNDDIRTRVEMILDSLGRRLEVLDSGNAYYAVHATQDNRAQQDARRFFTEVIGKARDELQWMELLAETTQQETYVQAGNLITYADVIHAIDFNQSLQQKLRQLLNDKNDASIDHLVSKLFERLKKNRIVTEENSRAKQYRFTSKLELLQQALVFVAMHNMLHVDETDNTPSSKQDEML